MNKAISLLGGRSDIRTRLLLTLVENPGKEFTEAQLAKLLNTSSSAVSKSLRPIAEGVLQNVLKTYPIFNNRVYKIEDTPITREFVNKIARQLRSTLGTIQQLDRSIEELHETGIELARLKEQLKTGKIDEATFEKRLSVLEKRARSSAK